MSARIVRVPELLLPAEGIDLTKWAVVACDQYTSEPAYWEALDRLVGGSPSALRCIFPEVYLGRGDEERIAEINRTVQTYFERGVFRTERGFVLVERNCRGRRRLGLVLAIDLEAYSYRQQDRAPVRATEGTILSRIPPRVKIREHAGAEFPHTMVLADDREGIIGGLYRNREGLKPLYDFELNNGGGRIRGWLVEDTEPVLEAFDALMSPEKLREKYGGEAILFAVGDGNHSLAAAKTCWDNLRGRLRAEERENHPMRFALVEAVNIYDEGLVFEPIHRVVKGADNAALASAIREALSGTCGGEIGLISAAGTERISAPGDTAACYRLVQQAIDTYLAESGGEADYIHGLESLLAVTKASGGLGVSMPALKKADLFGYVAREGALPRKTFSMGEADEKRYYLEGRKL